MEYHSAYRAPQASGHFNNWFRLRRCNHGNAGDIFVFRAPKGRVVLQHPVLISLKLLLFLQAFY